MEHKKFQPANLSASTFLFSREAWQVSHQASLFLARPVFTQNRITAVHWLGEDELPFRGLECPKIIWTLIGWESQRLLSLFPGKRRAVCWQVTLEHWGNIELVGVSSFLICNYSAAALISYQLSSCWLFSFFYKIKQSHLTFNELKAKIKKSR